LEWRPHADEATRAQDVVNALVSTWAVRAADPLAFLVVPLAKIRRTCGHGFGACGGPAGWPWLP